VDVDFYTFSTSVPDLSMCMSAALPPRKYLARPVE